MATPSSALRSWPLPLVLLAVACSDTSLHVIKDGEATVYQ